MSLACQAPERAMAGAAMASAVRVGARGLQGLLDTVVEPVGLVLFVHGSGSSLDSPRNRHVAMVLRSYRLATLRFNLLDDAEAADRACVFDIGLLAGRVLEALAWLGTCADVPHRPLGLFGASTGAAAAVVAAVQRRGEVGALVSRGGRVDLAADWLPRLQAPTLLIVGGLDTDVLRLNREALRALGCEKRLEVVPRASHLFEEPGALDTVAHLAASWFANHLGQRGPA